MITEDYVSYKTAKLLKEKGFDVYVRSYYEKNEYKTKEEFNENSALWNWNISSFRYSAPTVQMTMKWLREVYKLEVRSTYDYDKDSWWGNINPMFEETDENSDTYQRALGFDYQGKSYEQACEEAIRYCLENLV